MKTIPQVIVSHGEVWLQVQGALQMRDGFVQPALFSQDISQVVMRDRKVRFQLQGSLQMRLCFIQPVPFSQDFEARLQCASTKSGFSCSARR